MHWIQYTIPVIGCGLAGWAASLVAMHSLLYPRKPYRLPGITFQGIIPKNKEIIIQELAQIAGKELLSGGLEQKILDPQNFEQLKPTIEKNIDHFLREKLTDVFPLLSQFIGDKTINKLKAAFLTELETIFPTLLKNYIDQLKKGFDPAAMISQKLNDISSGSTSSVLLSGILKKEAGLLQVKAALTGICIGLLQAALMVLMF